LTIKDKLFFSIILETLPEFKNRQRTKKPEQGKILRTNALAKLSD
jgi:hypothetical protein